jgi:hypothetical protein
MVSRHVGIIGTFDVGSYGDLLIPVVAEHALRARRGGAADAQQLSRQVSGFGATTPVASRGSRVASAIPTRRRICRAGVCG